MENILRTYKRLKICANGVKNLYDYKNNMVYLFIKIICAKNGSSHLKCAAHVQIMDYNKLLLLRYTNKQKNKNVQFAMHDHFLGHILLTVL